MKKSFLIGTVIILILTSCESSYDDPEDGYLFKTDSGLEYKYSDFELYDSSTHIFYFKTNHPEFKTEKSSTFSLSANGEEICKGVFWPPYSSSLPYGPYIYSFFSFYPDYTFRIEFMSIDNEPEDTRNHPGLISALKEHNLLHSGLSVSINSVYIDGTQLKFKFTVTNQDESDLLILDIDKMGSNLFHYFTNGLSLRKLTYEEVFSSQIEPQIPSPRSDWNMDWLSELKSGDSRQFTINYTINSPISSGEYSALFEFPGLSNQVTKEELYQDNSRIWLGDIQVAKRLTIQ